MIPSGLTTRMFVPSAMNMVLSAFIASPEEMTQYKLLIVLHCRNKNEKSLYKN